MASPAILNFDVLLEAIPGDSPAGPDLRKSDPPHQDYWRLNTARYTARRAEERRLVEESADKADWSVLLKEAPPLLATISKDLNVAAWLTEALARQHGFAGLRDGFRLCRELAEKFWDHLHPHPDPQDEEKDERSVRVAALTALNGEDSEGTLIAPILDVPLVERPGVERMGVAAYDDAVAIHQLGDLKEKERRLKQPGVVPLQAFEEALRESSPAFFKNLMEDLEACRSEFDRLCQALQKRCGAASAPPHSNIRQALEKCRSRISALAPVSSAPTENSDGKAIAVANSSNAPKTSPPQTTGPIQSREEALKRIQDVADYFKKTEPHSVLSWQLEECIRWGKMALPDLLADLISDAKAREDIYKRVGIPPRKKEG